MLTLWIQALIYRACAQRQNVTKPEQEIQITEGPTDLPKRLQEPPKPIADNAQLAPDMGHTAAFSDIPDWLPISPRRKHRRLKSAAPNLSQYQTKKP